MSLIFESFVFEVDPPTWLNYTPLLNQAIYKKNVKRRRPVSQRLRVWQFFVVLMLVCLMAGTGCVSVEPRQKVALTDPPSVDRKAEPVIEAATCEQSPIMPLPEPKVESIEKEDTRVMKSELPDSTEEARPGKNGTRELTNQELIDSAMEFYQASNDFWDQGDLDNALGALDKSYSLILQVSQDADPELIQQKEDLRITISRRIIEVYSSRVTVANGNHGAIPLDMNKEVEKALRLFKGRERKRFIEAYRRSGLYRPMIVKALREAGLPEELSWLPLIESGYKVRALSRARALGLWQFIASTGYKYGLKRDRWIDERMDPEKSTQAAIAYLKELHQIFGEWTTALAGYNCGERRVLNRIKTQKIQYMDNFWDLYRRLPRETAFYVPKFLAVLHIVNDPKAHGFSLPEVYCERPLEEVTISKQLHLKTIAKQIDVDYSLLREINPELRQYITPNSPYALNVPNGKGKTLLAKLSTMNTYRPPTPSYVTHRVRKGQTLSGIARRYRTSVRSIMAANGLRSQHYLKVGWRLKIPTRGSGARVAASSYAAGSEITKYRVKKGDSLWKIALRFSTTTGAIKAVNGLRSSRLQIGQVLKVPKGSSTRSSSGMSTYLVRRGDSPYIIARKHRMDLADFLKANKLTPASTIYPGQEVKVISN
jgi:membrane-bound lytic murein transglycosylase D